MRTAVTTRALTSTVALLAAAVLGAGVSAALSAPAPAATPPPRVVTKPIAVTQKVAPKARPAAAPAQVAPTVSTLKATLVSGTTDSVTVEGVGTISGTPDVLLVGLHITGEADTAREALDRANDVAERVLATLRSQGVKPADIQTAGLFLNPTFDYHEGTQTKTGYVAGHTLSVQLRSAERRGQTISAASAVSEDVAITGLSFDLENNAGLLSRAQNAAFAMAKDEAARYARLAGRSLGRVMTIHQATHAPSAGPTPIAAGGGFGAGSASSVPIADGSQPVRVSVVVTWALR